MKAQASPAIIYTDIDRDGVLAGINWDSTLALAEAVSIPVIASGGLASMEDIRRLATLKCASLKGRFPAVRFTMAASTRRKHYQY